MNEAEDTRFSYTRITGSFNWRLGSSACVDNELSLVGSRPLDLGPNANWNDIFGNTVSRLISEEHPIN